MGDERPPQSWWTTLPGILTSVAAVITALTGLIVVLHEIRPPSRKSEVVKNSREIIENHVTSTMSSYPSEQLLMNTVWQFGGGRDGSTIIADRIRLLAGGRIEGYYHPNEARWGIEHGILVFYTECGEPSCRFTDVDRRDGRMTLSGKFLIEPGRSNLVIDVLREVQ